MKKNKLISAVIAVSIALAFISPLKAQSADAYNSLYLSFNKAKIDPISMGDESFKFDGGITVGYTRSKRIAPSAPLFLEVGFAMNLDMYSYGESYPRHIMDYIVVLPEINSEYKTEVYASEEHKFEYLNLAMPVGVMLDLSLGDGMSLQPFGGVNLKLGCSSKEVWEYELDEESIYGIEQYSTVSDFWYYYEREVGEPRRVEKNFYRESEVGAGEDWSRFLFGYYVGANFKFDKFIITGRYQADVTEIESGSKYSSFSVGVGVVF